MVTALLDADIITWKACILGTNTVSFDGVELKFLDKDKQIRIAKNLIQSWVASVEADNFIFCVSDRTEEGKSFRYSVAETYHGNRTEHPDGFFELHWDLVHEYSGVFHPGLEGDDILGILATNGEVDNPIMVTEDKDMLTVPAPIFFPTRSKKIRRTTELASLRQWFAQALIGDPADNYKGCKRIGQVRAFDAVNKLQTIESLWERTLELFLNAGHSEEYAIQQLRLAKILQASDISDDWEQVFLWHPTEPEPFTLPELSLAHSKERITNDDYEYY